MQGLRNRYCMSSHVPIQGLHLTIGIIVAATTAISGWIAFFLKRGVKTDKNTDDICFINKALFEENGITPRFVTEERIRTTEENFSRDRKRFFEQVDSVKTELYGKYNSMETEFKMLRKEMKDESQQSRQELKDLIDRNFKNLEKYIDLIKKDQ